MHMTGLLSIAVGEVNIVLGPSVLLGGKSFSMVSILVVRSEKPPCERRFAQLTLHPLRSGLCAPQVPPVLGPTSAAER